MLRIALRSHRTGFLACSGIGVLVGLAQTVGFKQAAGKTSTQRLQFGHEMELLARQISYLLPIPVHPETMAGYVQWRLFGFMPLVVAVWALLSATGAVRGEEERGLLETWLSAGVARPRLIAARLAGFVLAAAAAVAATSLGAALGAGASGSPLSVKPLLGQAVSLLALAVACFGLSLLVAQLLGTRREAAGWGGALLLALFFLNSLSRTAAHPGVLPRLSPFYLYDRTTVLAAGGRFDGGATLVLAALGAGFSTLAAAAFVRRDMGAALFRRRASATRPVSTPARNPLLRVPVLADLYEQRIGLIAWLAGTALLAIFFVSVAKQTADLIRKTPGLHPYVRSVHGPLDQAVIGLFWFGFLQLLLAAYAITQVSRWSSQDTEGRLEVELSAPVPRWRVVVERAGALALGCCAMILTGALAVIVSGPGQHIALDRGTVLGASLTLLPFGLAFGAIGAAAAGYLPRLAVPLLSAVAVASYLLYQIAPLFTWPSWVENLSVFALFGTPLSNGINWAGLWALIALTLAGFGLGIVTMQRREIGV